jgi:hypothetical protein
MNDAFRLVAERKIQEAMARGEFDDLPGKGQPQEYEDDSGVPEDLRLAYKILKNAGCVPPEIELKKEILSAEELLAQAPDEQEKYRRIKKLNFLVLKLNTLRPRAVSLEENERYYGRLVDKTTPGNQKGR